MKRARAEAIIDGKFESASKTLKSEVQLFYDTEGFDGVGLTNLHPEIIDPDSRIGALRRAYWTNIVKTLSHPHAYPSRYTAMSEWRAYSDGELIEGRIHIFKGLSLNAFKFTPQTDDTSPEIRVNHPALALDIVNRHELSEVDSVVLSDLLLEEEIAPRANLYSVAPEIIFSDIPVGFARITTNERLHKRPEILEMAMLVMGNKALREWRDNEFFEERQLGHIG